MNALMKQASGRGPRASVKALPFLLAVIALLALPSLAQVTSPKDIKTPPLRKFTVPQPKRVDLPNGMIVLLMEDHELPLVRASANIHGGDRDVPAAKAGLVDILGQAWRTGGTQTKTGDELDDFLEARAARVETSGDDDSTTVSMDVLKADFDTVFPIFIDLLRNPAFRQDKIDLAKTRVNTIIARRNDEPGGILSRELNKLGYGPGSPYSAEPEYATVAAITRDDLVAFHKKFVHPNNIVFAVGGDFNSAAMEKKLRDAFASWPKGPQAPPAPAAMTPPKPGVYFIAKSDVTQANIGLVHPGIQRDNPDYYAVAVMNQIFSGGFSGRLMQHLRSDRGLTYGVGGGIGAQWDYPGLFRMTMATKSGTTLESIEALRNEAAALTTQPFTADEMQLAKEAILNKFIFTMDSRGKVLNQAVMLAFYGFPADYFQKYPANIEKVTAEDVARVAKKYVHPDQLAVLVVGNEKDFEKPLSTLGPVTPVDITIPEPGAKPSAPAAAAGKPAVPVVTTPEAMALVNKVQEFTGGKAKIDGIKAIRSVTTANQKTPQGEMQMEVDRFVVYPDRQRSVVKMPMGEMTMVMTPEASFMVLPGMGTRDLPSSQREGAQRESRQELLAILKSPDKYTFAITGTEKVGGVDAKILEITTDGDTVKWLVDPASGKVLRRISRGRGPMAQGDQVTDFTAWKTFSGITLPTAFTTTSKGEQVGSGEVKNVEINPAVDPKMWEKPAS